jgi:hypothetical protein
VHALPRRGARPQAPRQARRLTRRARILASKGERRAKALATDARPGQILALALLANAPILVGFVLAPLASGPQGGRAFVPFVLWSSAPLAVASILLFVRTAPGRRQHRAARIGLLLALVALLLWALLLGLSLRMS